MRLFTAIDLSAECKEYISDVMKDMKVYLNKKGVFVPLNNFHITLEFLGEKEERDVERIRKAMDEVNIHPFSFLITGEIGYFTRERNKRTYFLNMAHSENLNRLQWELHNNLEMEGFPLEKRKYHPHITLVRNAYTKDVIPSFDTFKENVTSIHLMRSDRINGRMVYTSIYEKLLLNDPV